MDKIDIVELDKQVQKMEKDERDKLPEYFQRLSEFKSLKDDESLDPRVKLDIKDKIEELKTTIQNIEVSTKYNFYLSETTCILEEYREELRRPAKVNFLFPRAVVNTRINDLKLKYINIVKEYYDIKNLPTSFPTILKCNNCDNTRYFDNSEDTLYICQNCGSQQEKEMNTTSYCDINRVNIITKYSYDRKIHFRDCINQYQGETSSSIFVLMISLVY